LLHDFLASALQIPYDSIKNIEVQNPEILPNTIEGKLSQMDISLKVDNRAVNIEMQISSERDFKDRALFLWSQLFTGTLKKGQPFGLLKQSITINVLDFTMFDCSEFYSYFTVMERLRHEILTDKCAMLFLELPKISKELNPENRLELWLKVINSETEEEWLMLQNTGVAPIQQAVYALRQMSKDDKIRELARQRELALHNEASKISGAEQRGGDKRAIETARKMLKRNKPIEEIMEFTDLSREEIEKIVI